ncbi:MAG: hypothetical protein JXB00_12195 [Bacteroidales bacterium]|nr:hypothetical protein [Bacteroidales bacterium]
MKIEPNTDIGMKAVSILISNGKVELLDGTIVTVEELNIEKNAFLILCSTIDPNLNYINVLMPEHKDQEVYFKVRDIGKQQGIHVQSVTYRAEEAWNYWKLHKESYKK